MVPFCFDGDSLEPPRAISFVRIRFRKRTLFAPGSCANSGAHTAKGGILRHSSCPTDE